MKYIKPPTEPSHKSIRKKSPGYQSTPLNIFVLTESSINSLKGNFEEIGVSKGARH